MAYIADDMRYGKRSKAKTNEYQEWHQVITQHRLPNLPHHQSVPIPQCDRYSNSYCFLYPTNHGYIVLPTSPYHHHRIIQRSDYNSQLSIASYVCAISVKCTPRNNRVVLEMFLYPYQYKYVRNSRHVCTLRIPRISLSLRVHVQFLVQQWYGLW